MKLAFSGSARYAEMKEGYELYVRRSKLGNTVDEKTYNRIVKAYCRMLADKLFEDGMVDLPGELGTITAATITRKPQYRGKKFIGYGKMDWKRGHYDGRLKAFGIVFLPRRERTQNLRSYGFVANRRLFKRMKDSYDKGLCGWKPVVFNDDMV